MTNYAQIEKKAKKLIKIYGDFTLPINLTKIIEALQITLTISDPPTPELSGVLARGDEVKIMINKNHSKNRQRFSIAHELGHFFLHEGKELFIDGSTTYMLRSNSNSHSTPSLEREANAFAAALLMPQTLIDQQIGYLKESSKAIEKLSKIFCVSTEAMKFRLINLGYLVDY